MLLTTMIFTVALCAPGGTFCELTFNRGGLLTYPTVEACRAAAAAQTQNYEKAGSHGYYGRCVSKDVPGWTAQ